MSNSGLVSELIRAAAPLLLLTSLQRRAGYAYGIIQALDEWSGDRFNWREGTIYPILHRLEKGGMVRARWQQPKRGHRRRYYEITPEGRAFLTQGMRRWREIDTLLRRLGAA